MSDNINSTMLHQYLTFKLRKEMFAVDVSQVREVLDVTSITRMPHAPDFMRGVINLRGSVVPVVDLRMKFNMEKAEQTQDTRIVVLEIVVEDELITIGALADAVHNVTEIALKSIDPPPNIGAKWETEYIQGIGRHDDEFIIILNVDRIFSIVEMVGIETTEAVAAS
jgi:purine-binding chemotaxis protein CheW